jgi:hypothetical protein
MTLKEEKEALVLLESLILFFIIPISMHSVRIKESLKSWMEWLKMPKLLSRRHRLIMILYRR